MVRKAIIKFNKNHLPNPISKSIYGYDLLTLNIVKRITLCDCQVASYFTPTINESENHMIFICRNNFTMLVSITRVNIYYSVHESVSNYTIPILKIQY